MTYGCNKCDNQVTSERNLKSHIAQKHFGMKLNCNICHYKATTKYNLWVHTATQHLGTKHGCYLCGLQVFTAKLLDKHMMTHTRKCNQCEFTFVRKNGLRRHMMIHGRENSQEASKKSSLQSIIKIIKDS